MRGNCDLPSSRTCSIPPFALLEAAPLCSTSPPSFARQNFPKCLSFQRLFQLPSFPIPVLALYFVLATWVQPSHPASPRPSSVSVANLVLTHRLLSFLPLSAAVLYCTVLYCTVLYASFDVMVVGTNNLTCGFNCQCTADDIGYAVMITARLDSLPSPQSLSRFGSTPAGKQPGSKTEDWDRNGPQKMPVVSSSLCFPPVCCLLYNNGKTQIMWYTRPGSSEVPCNL